MLRTFQMPLVSCFELYLFQFLYNPSTHSQIIQHVHVVSVAVGLALSLYMYIFLLDASIVFLNPSSEF